MRQKYIIKIESDGGFQLTKEFNVLMMMEEREFIALCTDLLDFFKEQSIEAWVKDEPAA